jgi:hypothetical protein
LNQAFRLRDIDILLKFRFFIKDLHNQVKVEHLKYIETLKDKNLLIVYRGQRLSAVEFQHLRNNIGNRISFNSFMSTTTTYGVATAFSGNGSERPDIESVIFEISIARDAWHTIPFTKVNNVIDDENEILFSMGCICQIEDIEDAGDF